MVKRLFALFVALVIAGAPVALEACRIACASTSHHDHHHDSTAARAACHEAPATPYQLSPQAPPCNHDGEATVASVAAARTSDVVLLRAAAVPPIATVVFAASATFVPSRQSTPPDRLEIRLVTPLRI